MLATTMTMSNLFLCGLSQPTPYASSRTTISSANTALQDDKFRIFLLFQVKFSNIGGNVGKETYTMMSNNLAQVWEYVICEGCSIKCSMNCSMECSMERSMECSEMCCLLRLSQ